MMALIENTTHIQCDLEKVYEISQNYTVRYDWDPFPEKIKFLDNCAHIKRGVKVRVIAKNGLTMEVEFVQVKPPYRTAIKMTNGPIFLKSFAGSWIFKYIEQGGTVVIFKYSLKIKWWAFPFVLEPLACMYFAKVAKKRLEGLKQYCEYQSISLNPQ